MITRTLAGLGLAAASLVAAVPAEAQMLRGSFELQYRNLNTYGRTPLLQSWLGSFRVENSSHIGQSVEVWSQLRFAQVWFTGRPERARTPEGAVRLAHPNFGVEARYQPSETRDVRSITTRRQDASLAAYLVKPNLPAINASWTRGHEDAREGQPGSALVRRTVSAAQEMRRLGLRAEYSDAAREVSGRPLLAAGDKRLQAGANTHFEGHNWNTGLEYSFTQTRRSERDSLVDVTDAHTATAGGAARFSPRTAAALNYTLVHTGGSRSRTPEFTDQNGALSLNHRFNPVFQASGGTGVRHARVAGADETERYVNASLSADALVRPGWQLSASATQSLNWLPDQASYPVTAIQSRTSMQLAQGLGLNANASVTSSRIALAAGDTLASPNHRTLQAGAGLFATPWRPLSLSADAQRYQSLGEAPGSGPILTTYQTRFDWRMTRRLQSMGSWAWTQRSGSQVANGREVHLRVEWSPTSRLRTSGSYAQSRQTLNSALLYAPTTISRESYQAWMAMTLQRQLTLRVQLDDLDPRRRATHTREWTALLARGFGR
jgi:hypothetical protein